jgi:protein required for attachment to host cells
MQIPQGATIAVADGEKLNLFRNTGHEGHPKLTALDTVGVKNAELGSDAGHQSSSGNHDEGQGEEDAFAAGLTAFLNKGVLEGRIDNLVIIAAPRTLGSMRKHYHKQLSSVLLGEIAKDLTGHAVQDVEKAIAVA